VISADKIRRPDASTRTLEASAESGPDRRA
jgi:hypothetical protein